jgi:hypothetical protein
MPEGASTALATYVRLREELMRCRRESPGEETPREVEILALMDEAWDALDEVDLKELTCC